MNTRDSPSVHEGSIRAVAHDEATGASAFFIAYSLSENRKLLPDGSLLCLNVPIASLDPMSYAGVEVPPLMHKYGIASMQVIKAIRTEEDLFNDETISSLNSAPITIDHPAQDVSPENYQKTSRGSATNIRRGESDQSSFLLADLVVRDAEAIAAIEDGTARYISIGYSAQWVPVEEGVFRQTNIIGNHIALVDRPRGGYSLKIGDKLPMLPTNKQTRRKGLIARALASFKANDSAAGIEELQRLQDELDGEESTAPAINVNINGIERPAEPQPPAIPQTQDQATPAEIAQQAGQAATEKTEMKEEQFAEVLALLKNISEKISGTQVKDASADPALNGSEPENLVSTGDDEMPDDVDMSDLADEAVEEGIIEEKDKDRVNTKDSALIVLGNIIRNTAANALLVDSKLNLSSITDSANTLKGAVRNLHSLRCRVIDAAKLRPDLSSVFRDNGYRSFTTNKLGFREAGRLARLATASQIALNNKSAVHDSISGHILSDSQSKTPSQLNKMFRDYYKNGGRI